MEWDFSPPGASELKDHDVHQMDGRLTDKRVALLVTGSIAAYRTPDLVRDLRREGADVVVFISQEGLRYVAKDALEWTSLHPIVGSFTSDAEHLSDSRPFDVFLVAPATYNTINKMALGIADSVITSTLASALGRLEQNNASVLIAPAMHGTMHNSILTESLKKLAGMGVRVIRPRQENGKNNLPSHEILVAETIRSLSTTGLQGKEILITGGPTPVYLDRIRCITNHFTGALATQIAQEAYYQGATVHLVLGAGSLTPPEYLSHTVIRSYDDYVETVEHLLESRSISVGIFTAAVADYRPESLFDGKIPSGQAQSLKLVSTDKVIQRVQKRFPDLFMTTFKYEENVDHAGLMAIAQDRLAQGYPLVVANRGTEKGPNGEQIAWLVEKDKEEFFVQGKPQIACALLKRIEEKVC